MDEKLHGQWQRNTVLRLYDTCPVRLVRILFRRCKTKHDRPVYWRCSKGGKCESVSIREDDLEAAAEAMGLEDFDEHRFRGKVESIEAGKPDCLTVHFKSGRTEEISYTPTPSKRRPKARRKESGEKWQRQ